EDRDGHGDHAWKRDGIGAWDSDDPRDDDQLTRDQTVRKSRDDPDVPAVAVHVRDFERECLRWWSYRQLLNRRGRVELPDDGGGASRKGSEATGCRVVVKALKDFVLRPAEAD